jgi:hypothetical protein
LTMGNCDLTMGKGVLTMEDCDFDMGKVWFCGGKLCCYFTMIWPWEIMFLAREKVNLPRNMVV